MALLFLWGLLTIATSPLATFLPVLSRIPQAPQPIRLASCFLDALAVPYVAVFWEPAEHSEVFPGADTADRSADPPGGFASRLLGSLFAPFFSALAYAVKVSVLGLVAGARLAVVADALRHISVHLIRVRKSPEIEGDEEGERAGGDGTKEERPMTPLASIATPWTERGEGVAAVGPKTDSPHVALSVPGADSSPPSTGARRSEAISVGGFRRRRAGTLGSASATSASHSVSHTPHRTLLPLAASTPNEKNNSSSTAGSLFTPLAAKLIGRVKSSTMELPDPDDTDDDLERKDRLAEIERLRDSAVRNESRPPPMARRGSAESPRLASRCEPSEGDAPPRITRSTTLSSHKMEELLRAKRRAGRARNNSVGSDRSEAGVDLSQYGHDDGSSELPLRLVALDAASLLCMLVILASQGLAAVFLSHGTATDRDGGAPEIPPHGDNGDVGHPSSLLPFAVSFALHVVITIASAVRFAWLGTLSSHYTVALDYVVERRVAVLCAWMVMISHMSACAYGAASLMQGLGSSPFVLPAKYVDMGLPAYGEALFFAFMVITGSKEVDPVTPMDKTLAALIVILGTIMSLTLVGNIAALLSTMDQASAAYRDRLMLISDWARHQSLPGDICARIESHLRITWNATRGIDTDEILSGFPERLRADIAMHLVGSIIRSVPLFQGCDEGFLNTLVPLLRHELYAEGSVIVARGERSRQMYFLSKGSAHVLNSADPPKVIHVITTGFFGEISCFFDEPRSATVVAGPPSCEVMVLTREDLDLVLVRYPEYAEKIINAAVERARSVQGTNPALKKVLLGAARKWKAKVDSSNNNNGNHGSSNNHQGTKNIMLDASDAASTTSAISSPVQIGGGGGKTPMLARVSSGSSLGALARPIATRGRSMSSASALSPVIRTVGGVASTTPVTSTNAKRATTTDARATTQPKTDGADATAKKAGDDPVQPADAPKATPMAPSSSSSSLKSSGGKSAPGSPGDRFFAVARAAQQHLQAQRSQQLRNAMVQELSTVLKEADYDAHEEKLRAEARERFDPAVRIRRQRSSTVNSMSSSHDAARRAAAMLGPSDYDYINNGALERQQRGSQSQVNDPEYLEFLAFKARHRSGAGNGYVGSSDGESPVTFAGTSAGFGHGPGRAPAAGQVVRTTSTESPPSARGGDHSINNHSPHNHNAHHGGHVHFNDDGRDRDHDQDSDDGDEDARSDAGIGAMLVPQRHSIGDVETMNAWLNSSKRPAVHAKSALFPDGGHPAAQQPRKSSSEDAPPPGSPGSNESRVRFGHVETIAAREIKNPGSEATVDPDAPETNANGREINNESTSHSNTSGGEEVMRPEPQSPTLRQIRGGLTRRRSVLIPPEALAAAAASSQNSSGSLNNSNDDSNNNNNNNNKGNGNDDNKGNGNDNDINESGHEIEATEPRPGSSLGSLSPVTPRGGILKSSILGGFSPSPTGGRTPAAAGSSSSDLELSFREAMALEWGLAPASVPGN